MGILKLLTAPLTADVVADEPAADGTLEEFVTEVIGATIPLTAAGAVLMTGPLTAPTTLLTAAGTTGNTCLIVPVAPFSKFPKPDEPSVPWKLSASTAVKKAGEIDSAKAPQHIN